MPSAVEFSASACAIVVIGRNEGDRLLDCLESLRCVGALVIYVDSGSSDGSAARAHPICDQVVELDPERPFSAARGRNEGFAAAMLRSPNTQWVQFLDGDCTLSPAWMRAATDALANDDQRAVVIGPLQERHPEASVYNRLCALEWKSPPGDLTNFGSLGGILLVWASVFARLGGFNENVIAGEDSEFGVRVGEAGFKITKIAMSMATHDANIHRFTQWWTRTVRSGHATGQRFSLNGSGASRDCAREHRSIIFWGLALPAAVVLLAWPTRGASLLLLVGYLVLAQRVARYRLGCGDSATDANTYARFNVLGKLAEGVGLLKFQVNRLFGRSRGGTH